MIDCSLSVPAPLVLCARGCGIFLLIIWPVCRILDEFGGRGWMPLKPELLEYENTQFLLIGHKDDALEKAGAQPEQAEEGEKETPLEELEKLEEENEGRVEGLKGMCCSFYSIRLYEDDDGEEMGGLLIILQEMMRYSQIWDLARRNSQSCRRLGDSRSLLLLKLVNGKETTHAGDGLKI